MILSNVSNIRFSGSDVRLAKIDGVIIYRKDEEDALLIARYTANASGVLPTFNDAFEGYETEEINNNGIYTVTIRTNKEDNLPTKMSFQGNKSLLSVEYLNTSNVTDMSAMFRECTSLTSLDLSGWNTSSVTNMHDTFRSCTSLTSLDLSGLDASNVTDMGALFAYSNNLTSIVLDSLNTSNVSNMGTMFYKCSSLTSLDLSEWNTGNVTVMSQTFNGCTKLASLNMSGWDTSNVTAMNYLFTQCSSLTSLDLSSFDVSKVTNMTSMFQQCNALTSLDSMKNIATNLSLSPSLNKESVLDVIDNLSTVDTTKTLTMSATQLSWVSEDKIIEANNKGWTISA